MQSLAYFIALVTVGFCTLAPASPYRNKLQEAFESRQSRIIEFISTRNTNIFDREIKFQKIESKKILTLDEKLTAQKAIKEMEKKRNAMRRNLFEAQDEIEKRKEGLIADVESRLRQRIKTQELFAIRWQLV